MTAEPERYAVIGHPIAHSRSPWIHAQFARQTGQLLTYSALDLPGARLAEGVRDFFARGGRGLNVTVPHKQAVVGLVEQLSERARIAGAVNTIIHQADDRLCGDNTDGSGLLRDLTHNLSVTLTGRRVLLLGAGGAARGLIAPLLAEGPSLLVIANRTPERAHELAQLFAERGPVQGAAYGELDQQSFGLIINATAAGLQQQRPPLPERVLRRAEACYDLCYARGTLQFIEWARACGIARCFTGAGMLVEQAAESFLLWRGVRPATLDVIASLEVTA